MEWCERKQAPEDPEIVNAVTSLCISLAGTFVCKDSVIFGASLITIGFGSYLFHYYATDESRCLDEAPILVYALSYFGTIVKVSKKFLLGLIFFGYCFMIFVPKYNCLFLILLAIYGVSETRKLEHVSLSTTSLVFGTLSLGAWIMDFAHCPFLTLYASPERTYHLTWHSIWHVCIAFAGYFATVDLVKSVNYNKEKHRHFKMIQTKLKKKINKKINK